MTDFDIDSFLDSNFKKFSKKKEKKVEQSQTNNLSNNIIQDKLSTHTIDSKIYEGIKLNSIKDPKNQSIEDVLKPLFPNEKVYQKEFTSDKSFVLDKFIKTTPKTQRKLPKQNYTKHLIKAMKKEEMNYNDLLQMNQMWNEYVTNLMNKGTNPDTISAKMTKCDLHGAIIEVINSVNKNNIGIKGIMLFESKKTFNILCTNNKLKTILKQGTIFSVRLPYGDIEVNIIGDNFMYKSAERTKVKYKTKYNLNLNLLNI